MLNARNSFFPLLSLLLVASLCAEAAEEVSAVAKAAEIEIITDREPDKAADQAAAKSAQNPLCFDFAKTQYTEPLRAPAPLKEGGRDTYQQGVRTNYEWASGRSIVPRTVKEMYTWLLDHTNWKDMTKTKMKVTVGSRPNYADFHEVAVDVRVWAFITISWVEQWAYKILAGTKEKPEKFLVSYQKVSGTSHLESLCGSVLVSKFDDFDSDVYFYEQAKASRYKADDIMPMHVATIKILKGEKVPENLRPNK